MITLLAISGINQQHSYSIPFHMRVQQTIVEFTHSCHYYRIMHVNEECQTNWQLTPCRLQVMHMGLNEQDSVQEKRLLISLSVILSNLIGYSYLFSLV
jgi:hypothetical protein